MAANKKKSKKQPAKKSNKRYKQNKSHGHYCKVCGERKANEKFSGKGHAAHICKKCAAMPVSERNTETALRRIEGMAFRWLSEAELKWLRKKMNDKCPEIRDAARGVHDIKFPNHGRDLDKLIEIKTPVLFSELKDEHRSETVERLEELIDDFFLGADYIPDDEDRDGIIARLCEEMSETVNEWEPEPYDPASEYDHRFDFDPELSIDERIKLFHEALEAEAEDFDPYAEPEKPEPKPQKELVPDNELKAIFDEIIARIITELKAEGIELPTFMDTLIVAETERLKIRRFHRKTDLDALWNIMKKPEAMYAWEGGFKKSEVRKWINKQYTRYNKDGYGYYAVILKESGKLIGQAGLMKNDLNGESIVEIGYIFDNGVWGQGYALEAARECVEMGFEQLGLDKLYITTRPENTASVRIAEKLGMQRVGECVKTYKDIEMPHDIYLLENTVC